MMLWSLNIYQQIHFILLSVVLPPLSSNLIISWQVPWPCAATPFCADLVCNCLLFCFVLHCYPAHPQPLTSNTTDIFTNDVGHPDEEASSSLVMSCHWHILRTETGVESDTKHFTQACSKRLESVPHVKFPGPKTNFLRRVYRGSGICLWSWPSLIVLCSRPTS